MAIETERNCTSQALWKTKLMGASSGSSHHSFLTRSGHAARQAISSLVEPESVLGGSEVINRIQAER
jgi:hypothetical protein